MGTLWTLESTHPGLSLYSKKPLAFGTAYYSLSFGLNIILTILIVVRLLACRRNYLRVLPPRACATLSVTCDPVCGVCGAVLCVRFRLPHLLRSEQAD